MDAERLIDRGIKLLFEAGSILVGLGGVVYQLKWAPGGPNAAVLAVLAGIASAPILTNLRALAQGSAGTTSSMPGSQSPSPPPSQAADSSPQQ